MSSNASHDPHGQEAPQPDTSPYKKVYELAQKALEQENVLAAKQGGVSGLYNPIDMLLWYKNEMCAGFNDEVKREIAINTTQHAESEGRARTMGMAAVDRDTSEIVWADEVICYKAPPGYKPSHHGYYYWWDENNQPPERPLGVRLKHGEDFHVVEMPLRVGYDDKHQPIDATTLNHFHGSLDELYGFAWNKTASNYAGYIGYKMRRGNAETWAEKVSEPAVFMDQKPKSTKELMFEDRRENYKEICLVQHKILSEKIDQIMTYKDALDRKQLDPTVDLDVVDPQKQYPRDIANWGKTQKHLEELWGAREGYRQQYEKIIDYQEKHPEVKSLPKDWETRTVESGFSEMSTVGRMVYAGIWGQLAVSLSRSRRPQPRMVRIIGFEPEDDGTMDENRVIYSRLSDAFDYNELLTNAILNRSGLATDQNLPKLKKIEHNLNEWRAMMGLSPITFRPNIEKGLTDRDLEKGEKESQVAEGGRAVKIVHPSELPHVKKRGVDTDSGTESTVKSKPVMASTEGARPASLVNTSPSKAQEDYYKMQNEEKYFEHRTEYPPPDWKKSKQEWKLVDPDMKKSRWEGYFTRWGVDGLDPMLKMKNEEKWKRLWKKLGDAVRPTPEDLEDE